MAVPGGATFLVWCGKSVAGSVSGICDALGAHSDNPSIDTLYIVYKECDDWKKKHVSALFSSASERRKETAVNRVQGEVIDDLNALKPGLGDALAGYQFKKSSSGIQGGAFAKLGAGYSHERTSYLAGGKKQAPLSGSRVHSVATGIKQDFAGLSSKEFERLGTDPALLKKHLADSTVVRMYFLNKIQRLKLLASCDRTNPLGPRWLDISGQLMHSKTEANRSMAEDVVTQMWAMDRYGNLFVDYDNSGYGTHVLNLNRDQQKGAIRARGQTNHSSFCAGREVICAGTIYFWKGQLIHIDNNSGHYAPNRQALFNAVSILWNDGAVLDYLRVGVAGKDAPSTFHRGTTFLHHGGADWPEQDQGVDQEAIFRRCPGFLF